MRCPAALGSGEWFETKRISRISSWCVSSRFLRVVSKSVFTIGYISLLIKHFLLLRSGLFSKNIPDILQIQARCSEGKYAAPIQSLLSSPTPALPSPMFCFLALTYVWDIVSPLRVSECVSCVVSLANAPKAGWAVCLGEQWKVWVITPGTRRRERERGWVCLDGLVGLWQADLSTEQNTFTEHFPPNTDFSRTTSTYLPRRALTITWLCSATLKTVKGN